jgi:photosystem II stability/assembly factor-like uncharacterized protein
MLSAGVLCGGCSPSARSGAIHPASAVIPVGSAGGTLALQSVRMITASTGWAVAGGPNQSTQILVRTTDGGRTWRDAGPAALRGPYFLWNASFYSARAAWLTLLRANLTRPVIYRTTDGGRTWQRTGVAPVDATYASAPDMLGGLGWITTSRDYGMGKEISTILRTTDGGARWRLAELSSPVHPTPGALPAECGKNDAVFSAPAVGWVTAGCISAHPLPFWRSGDEGRTWRYAALPSPWRTGRLSTCQCYLSGPAFTSPGVGVIWGQAGPGSGPLDLAGVAWLTRDGGLTWVPVRLPDGLQPIGAPDFVGSRRGYVLGGQFGPSGAPPRWVRLLATSDGGVTWTLTSARRLPGATIVDFVTPATGFALVPGTRYLLRTNDGGITWTVIPASRQNG